MSSRIEYKIEQFGNTLKKYPAAHRTVMHAYRTAYMASALVRRPYQIRNYLKVAEEFTGLQIGAGHHQIPGWLKTDLLSDPNAVYLNATKRFPFADKTFDYIVAEHIIEHIPYEAALKMLQECHRVLKDDGVVRISTPDIELTHELMHIPLTPSLERYVSWSNRSYGSTEILDSAIHVVNRLHHEWGHQFLYDSDTLIASLRRAGFFKIAECSPSKSDHAALVNIDHHAEVSGEFNELESLIVEAIK